MKIRITDKKKLKKYLAVLALILVNAIAIASIFVVYGSYVEDNKELLEQENLKNLANMNEACAVNTSAYLDSVSTKLNDVVQYINDKGYTIDHALEMIYETNSDPDKYIEIVRCDNFTGYSATKKKDGENFDAVNYTTYGNLMASFNDLTDSRYENMCYTPVFTDQVTRLKHFALYRHVTLKDGEADVECTVLLSIRTTNVVRVIKTQNTFEGQSSVIISSLGNYIVNNTDFMGVNFFDYLKEYNGLTLDQRNEMAKSMMSNAKGEIYYKNYLGKDCVFSYVKMDGENKYCVTCVPLESFHSDTSATKATLILIILFGVLFLLDIICLVLVNRRLSLSVSQLDAAKIAADKTNETLENTVTELDKAKLAAEAANTAKSSFLAHMSHEMRTPLNAITSVVRLIEDEKVDPKVEMLLGKVDTASAHLLGIINDVLDFSKIGDGKMTIHNEEFAMQDVVDVIAVIYSEQARLKSISLMMDCDFDKEHYLIGDVLRIKQVIVNLVSNAIKYNSKGGFVKVHIHQLEPDVDSDKEKIRFEVEDSGFGISPQHLLTMFEPFTRDYTDKTKAISGTGLGLAISRQLVNLMGGEIHATSELDKGSKFFFTLELEKGGAIVAHEQEPEIDWNKETLTGIRILLVEDNEMNSFIAQNLLENVGATVETAFNGEEGVKMLVDSEDGYYDIILMDILMPIMDGIEAADTLRALPRDYAKNIPIVALSANAFKEDIDNSLAHGMNAHLLKPIDVDAFYKTIFDLTVKPKSV